MQNSGNGYPVPHHRLDRLGLVLRSMVSGFKRQRQLDNGCDGGLPFRGGRHLPDSLLRCAMANYRAEGVLVGSSFQRS